MKKKVTATPQKSKERMIADLEALFERALLAENFSVALKTKELLAKVYGLLDKTTQKPLSEWSEEELEKLLHELESS